MTAQEASQPNDDATPPTQPPATTSQQTSGTAAKGKGKAKGSAAAALDPAVIEAKRRARAEKKEREAREKVLKEEEEQRQRRAGLGLAAVDAEGRPLYRPRQWALVEGVKEDGDEAEAKRRRPRIKVLSWNMLAQGLVRRKLFPGSDAMRWKDREAGLGAELLGHGFDAASLQEVDRIETHAATLRKGGYSHLFAKGYAQKQHGLCLAWRTSSPSHQDILFEEQPAASKIIYFDDEEVEQGRTGCSRVTRNIALVAALRFKRREGDGVGQGEPGGIILATTHLFWHPTHAYERVRQAGLLIRALQRFRGTPSPDSGAGEPPVWRDWPVILAGDFNDQPHSASYALLTGRLPLDSHAREEIAKSSVVHQSVDERSERERLAGVAAVKEGISQDQESSAAEEKGQTDEPAEDEDDEAAEEGDEEEEEGGADDQILKNCRPAQPSDGLLSLSELESLFTLRSASPSPQYMRSAYATAYHQLSGQDESDNLFSTPTRGRERWDDPDWKEGDPNVHRVLAGTPAGNEPMWTLYSSLFGLTLDYILMMPAEGEDEEARYPTVRRLLRTHRTDVIKEGLPRKGICVSDHVAVGAELEL